MYVVALVSGSAVTCYMGKKMRGTFELYILIKFRLFFLVRSK